MQVTLEQVMSDARALLPDDQERLRQWLEEQAGCTARERQRQAQLEEDRTRHELIRYWLTENHARYMGQWVALDGDRLIVASENDTEFVAAVRASGVKVPFVTKIEEEERHFAGW